MLKICLCRFEALSNQDKEILYKTLSRDEETKALDFIDEEKRDLSILSDAFKRFVLAAHSDQPAQSLQFSVDAFGKPSVIISPQLYFNLSHTAGLIAVIICDKSEVGIDAEKVQRRDDLDLISSVVFSPDELKEAISLSEKEKLENFYFKWTVKEAFLKAIGTGFSTEPSLLTVKNHNDRISVETDAAINADDRKIEYLRIEGYALAYACKEADPSYTKPTITHYRFAQGKFERL